MNKYARILVRKPHSQATHASKPGLNAFQTTVELKTHDSASRKKKPTDKLRPPRYSLSDDIASVNGGGKGVSIFDKEKRSQAASYHNSSSSTSSRSSHSNSSSSRGPKKSIHRSASRDSLSSETDNDNESDAASDEETTMFLRSVHHGKQQHIPGPFLIHLVQFRLSCLPSNVAVFVVTNILISCFVFVVLFFLFRDRCEFQNHHRRHRQRCTTVPYTPSKTTTIVEIHPTKGSEYGT